MRNHLPSCDCDPCLVTHLRTADAAARQAAWETWYRRDAPLLLAFLERRCRQMGCVGHAEDILQESFVAAFHNISNGRYTDKGAALCAYLHGIAKNLLFGVLRLQRRELDGFEPSDTEAGCGLSLEEALVVVETRQWVGEAKTRQPTLHQRVVDALYGEGRSSDEVAVTVGKSAGNTRQIAYRAVHDMAGYLKQRYHTQLSSHAIRTCLELLEPEIR